jgi:hypothetical protein
VNLVSAVMDQGEAARHVDLPESEILFGPTASKHSPTLVCAVFWSGVCAGCAPGK